MAYADKSIRKNPACVLNNFEYFYTDLVQLSVSKNTLTGDNVQNYFISSNFYFRHSDHFYGRKTSQRYDLWLTQAGQQYFQ